jgi:hypothetical protein
MVGGVEPWTFRVEPEELKTYVNSKYGKEFSHLELVAFGYVGITNRSKGFFTRADHRLEQIVVFACDTYTDTNIPSCYAIARCNGVCPKKEYKIKNDERPNFEMEKNILFFQPGGIEIKYPTESSLTSDDKTKKSLELLKKKLEERYREEVVNHVMSQIMVIEFTNTISSSDRYRIVLLPGSHSETLKPFFSSVKSEYVPTGVQYPVVTQTRTQQQGSENNEQSYDSTGIGDETLFVFIINLFMSLIS